MLDKTYLNLHPTVMGACRHGQGGTCPLWKCKRLDSLQSQLLVLTERTKIMVTRHVLRVHKYM